MNLPDLDEKYWENRYQTQDTGWDLGEISRPLKEYFDQLTKKNLKILIPGCGKGHEAEYLHKLGFKNIFPSDISASAKEEFFGRVTGFPRENWISDNFFSMNGQFDLIIEQTFFCALNPELRENYAKKMAELLCPGGQLTGLLFTEVPNENGPPFGGDIEEYFWLFEKYFDHVKIESCYNSIPPRAGREVFFTVRKN